MQIRVVSFGPLRSAFPPEGQWMELSRGESVADMLQKINNHGQLSDAALRSYAVAINHEYASRDTVLQDGDEVAILPPVSGGAESLVRLVQEPIDADDIVRRLKAPADGAVVIFDGIVRDNTRGRRTIHLDYEAYEEMALKQLHQLRADAIGQFGVRDAAIVHRLGRLFVGETSVLIAVASAHRGAAFEACRWIIDTLKKTVPIWKREQFEDGAVWVDGEPFPEELTGAPR